MAFCAIWFRSEGGLAVMAGAAGLAGIHVGMGHPFAVAVREYLGVAIAAFVNLCVEIMAEISLQGTLAGLEGHIAWFDAWMALVAISAGGKGSFAVMTGAAGFTGIHVGHGHPFAVAVRE